jgi:phage-related protein (TIGR01555 family)
MSKRTNRGTFAPGVSGNPAGRRAKNRLDDWQNFATGAGIFGRDKRIGAQFNLHQLSFDQLKDLWLGDDLASRAVETIPREALRQGYDITISSAQDHNAQNQAKGSAMDPTELAAEVTQKLDILGADEYLEIVGAYERGYGGGALLIGANDGQSDLTQPLNLNRVRSIDWITPLEARELMPLYAYADPRAPKFGQPEIYQLTSRSVLPSYSGNYQSATMLIHESRLIPFPGIRVSRYQVTTARGGWGESVLNRLFRVLRDFNTAWSSAGVLVTDFAQSVIKIAGLWEALALDGNQAFANRLAAMEYGRSVVNALTIDAGDDYSRQQTPLTGLPDLLEKFAVRLAAACDMPLTLLFGTSPAGLNATGESDVRFFYDRVASYQKRKMEPALRRLCQVIFRTIGNKQEPDKWSVKFRPLWQDSAKDKATAMFSQAQADNIWITAGVLSPEEVASSHWGKGEYDPNLAVNFEAREAQEAAAQSPVSAEDLNAMDPNHYMYQPPPEPGTAVPPGEVPAPGKPAAPDPNTKPVSHVQLEDSADDARARVLKQLGEDYPDDKLDWVRKASWTGPRNVDLDKIDTQNKAKWRAQSDDARVTKFMKHIKKDKVKPIILVDRPGKDKMMIADGHHRFLAHEKLDRPPLAFVAKVDKNTGDWDEFHDSQKRKDQDEPAVVCRSCAGVEVAVEVLGGEAREGFAGEIVVPYDYGYIPGVKGADGDSLDAMIGPNVQSKHVFVFQQMLPREGGEWIYLQDKVMLGFDNESQARAAMVALHNGNKRYVGPCREISPTDLVTAVDQARMAGGRMQCQLSTGESVRADERDERMRFAGKGYGMPSPEQAVARGGHERRAMEHGLEVAHHAAKARELHAQAEQHAKDGDWMAFGDTSRKAVQHQAKAAQSMVKVTYHAERAGTPQGREIAAAATRELARRDAPRADEWSEAAREAAAEARKKNAEKPNEKPTEKPAKREGKKGKGEKPEKAKTGEHAKSALEFGKAAAEIVGGKEAGEVAEGVSPEIEGGEREKGEKKGDEVPLYTGPKEEE